MHELRSSYGTSLYDPSFLDDLYSFEGIPDLPQQSSYPQPLTVQNEDPSLALVNSVAIKTIPQTTLKRKREEEPVIREEPVLLQRETKKDDVLWRRSAVDVHNHEEHIAAHHEKRQELQKNFEMSHQTKQNDFLINNIPKIIQISYSPISENIRYSFEEIKKTILEIKFNHRLVLLKWMLYSTEIEPVRLINLLVQFGLPLDEKLMESIEKLTEKIIYEKEQKDLSTFHKLKRQKGSIQHNFEQFHPTYAITVPEDILEAQPTRYPAFPEHPCYETQYNPPHPLALVNSVAIKTLPQTTLKRKREEVPVINDPRTKRAKKENLDERIRRFVNLNETQKRELLNKSTSLIQKYYKGSRQDEVLKFISEIDNRTSKIALLTWIKCMKNTSIVKQLLEMLSEDPKRFNTSVKNYISITSNLDEKTLRLSRYITGLLQRETKKDDALWKRSGKDVLIHKEHMEAYHEKRLKLQKTFELSNESAKNAFFMNNIDGIIEICYCQIVDNTRYLFEEIKDKILTININARLVLLQWMLYCPKIETVRLINLLVKYNLALDGKLVSAIKKLIFTTTERDLNSFRQIAKRREKQAISALDQSKQVNKTATSEKDIEMQPIEYPAFQAVEHPIHQPQYAPLTPISTFAHNFQPYNPCFQFLPPVLPLRMQQNQKIYNYMPQNHP